MTKTTKDIDRECAACGRLLRRRRFCGHVLIGCAHCRIFWEE